MTNRTLKYLKRKRIVSTNMNGSTLHYLPIPALRNYVAPKYIIGKLQTVTFTVGTHAVPPFECWIKPITEPSTETCDATNAQ